MKKSTNKTILLSSFLTLWMADNVAKAACVSSLISLQVISAPMAFGTIDPCTASAGSVSLNAKNGARTTTGCINSVTGISNVATIVARGNQAKNNDRVVVKITSPVNTMANGPNTMTLTSWDLSLKGGGLTVTMNGRQTRTMGIGATLNVAAGQASGTYTGQFTVSAVCQ